MLEGLIAEFTFGNMGTRIPTYVRNANSDAAYQVDSANTATSEKCLNGPLESNREGLVQNHLLGVGYIPVDINTSYGINGSLSSANLINLMARNIS